MPVVGTPGTHETGEFRIRHVALGKPLNELTVLHQLCFCVRARDRFRVRIHQRLLRHGQRGHHGHLHAHLKATPAVLYSGFCNFLGVLLGGTAVAFAIVNLLPVDLLIESSSARSVVMVISLLLAGKDPNLGTWWPVCPFRARTR